MQSIYWFCFTIGGVFVALSSLGGQNEVDFGAHTDFDFHPDFDTDADADIDADADADIDADADADLEGSVSTDIDLGVDTDVALSHDPPKQSALRKSPMAKPRRLSLGFLTSFKFWTMGSCFFGLTGLVLSRVQPNWSTLIILILALVMGLICGGGLATILRALRRRQVDSLVRNEDFAGLVGTVELPFDVNSKGKISLEVRGTVLHMIALTDDQQAFLPGDKVLVVGASNNRLWVVSTETAENS